MTEESVAKEAAVGVRPLTDRQQAILSFIVLSIRTQGYPPTLREIGHAFGIRSTKGVNDHLEALEKKGKIRRRPELSRAIEIVDAAPNHVDVQNVPLLGRIAAGEPLLAIENIEQTIALDRSLAREEGAFLLRVQGDSMIKAHICDGDYILVRPQDTADEGEIVAALVDDEATVKRFFRDGDRIRLEPENDSMSSIVVEPSETPVRILGKVIGVFRVL
jgi:repressor LexA